MGARGQRRRHRAQERSPEGRSAQYHGHDINSPGDGWYAFRMWARRPAGQPLVLAHRGASAVALEITVEAFARARADGADGVELDVLACATGEVVVFHDDDLG